MRRIGTDGVITTVAGNGERGGAGDGGPAISAQLLGPRNLVLDSAGNLYFSEFDGHRVRRVAVDGTITTFAGTGIAGLSGDGGPARDAQLNSPAGLALDGAGALYIADTLNARIRKVQGGIIITVCDRRAFGAPYVQLSGIAADRTGLLYLAESANSFVWQLRPDGALIRVAGAPGSGAYAGDGERADQTALNKPVDVTLDGAGNLYISEFRRVRQISVKDGTLATAVGDGTFGFSGDGGGAALAALNAPTGLAIRDGDLYIADEGNQRIRKATSDGLIYTVAGNGQASYAGDGLSATGASLFRPAAVAFDAAGDLYIADSYNSRVRRVDPSGVIITFAGNGESSGFGAEGGLAVLTALSDPSGIATDGSGNVYVADTGGHRVIRVDPEGNLNTVAGTGSPGYTGEGDISSLPQLDRPSGLAFDGDGNLYIADTLNHRIRMLTPGGVISTVGGTGTGGFSGDGGDALTADLNQPCTAAVDASRNLYIADSGNNRIRMVTPDGKISTIAGTGDGTYNGDEGPAPEIALSNPCGLAVDGEGNLLVADTGNNRIRKLTPGQAVVPPPQLVDVSLANAASMRRGSLAPGEIFSVFGQGLGPDAGLSGAFDASGMLPTSLGDVQVLFDETPAPLFYVQASQINAQVPYEVARHTSAQFQILYQGAPVVNIQVSLVDASPAIFTLNSSSGSAVAVKEDGSINSDQNPAARGSIVVLYATGEGQTTPGGVTGRAAQAPLGAPRLPVSLTIAGIPAEILYAGSAPGFVGLMQINARIPAGFVPPGDLPVVLRVGPYQSPAGVTLAVQ